MRKILIAAWAAGLFWPLPALSGTATGQFDVTATVLDNCTVTASDLAFGNYVPSSGTASTASTTLQVVCTPSLDYAIALDGGVTTGAVAARAMSDGGTNQLAYGLYTSNTYSTIWGDGTGTTQTVAGTGNGAVQLHTVYGRLPASQFVAAGSYTDRITVTVSY